MSSSSPGSAKTFSSVGTSGTGSGVDACDCPNVPINLTATFSCTDCPCGNGTTVDLTYQGGGEWTGSGTFCSQTVDITLTCQVDGQWILAASFSGGCDPITSPPTNEDSCDPFQVTFGYLPPNLDCCDGAFPDCTIIITA